MARCFCACHEYPGTYPPPCNVCGHHNDHGRYPGALNMGWVPDGEEVGPLRIDAGPRPDEMVRIQIALDAAEQEVERLNRLVDTLSRALARYQDEEIEVGGDEPADHPYQRRGSWSADDWCAVEGCTSKASAHSA